MKITWRVQMVGTERGRQLPMLSIWEDGEIEFGVFVEDWPGATYILQDELTLDEKRESR